VANFMKTSTAIYWHVFIAQLKRRVGCFFDNRIINDYHGVYGIWRTCTCSECDGVTMRRRV